MQLACAPSTELHASSADSSFAPGTEDDTHPDDHAEHHRADLPYTTRPKGKSHAWIVPVVLGGIGLFASAVIGVVALANGISSGANTFASSYRR